MAQGSGERVEPEYVDMPLDHFSNRSNATFRNRFWVHESSYIGQGHPVFIYDVGETGASGSAYMKLKFKDDFFRRLVDGFGGIGVVWEHRYYGSSNPSEKFSSNPLEGYKYLTIEQALKDVEYFATHFSRRKFPNSDLTPASTPWVFVGGSYPGMRAAWMRQFFPHIIFASYASSAPVQINLNSSAYADQIYDGMNAYGFGNCSRDLHSAVVEIDKLLEKEPSSSKLKRQFLGRNGEKFSDWDFVDAVNNVTNKFKNYGMEGGLREFCDWIETDHKKGTLAGAEGWAPTRGPEFVIKQWATWAKRTGIQARVQLSSAESSSEWMDAYTWQVCTQVTGFMTVEIGPKQLYSSHLPERYRRQCAEVASANVSPDEMNRRLGGWNIRPSNTFWTAGQFDPWTPWTPFSKDPSAPHPNVTQKIPACNVPTQQGEIFGRLLQNAQHGDDLGSEHPQAVATQQLFMDALRQWLKCFRPKRHSSPMPFGD
ncbi:serine carboxypeptidase S28-domain-containing protein [Phyllosticta capitalensis]